MTATKLEIELCRRIVELVDERDAARVAGESHSHAKFAKEREAADKLNVANESLKITLANRDAQLTTLQSASAQTQAVVDCAVEWRKHNQHMTGAIDGHPFDRLVFAVDALLAARAKETGK